MRRTLPAFILGLLALEVVSVVGSAGIIQRPVPLPLSLKFIAVPQPVGIEQFVKSKPAAVALGKALFWDMQAGSDGTVACATCHFQAGADTRTVNQLNPGGNHQFEVGGPNHPLVPADYPFHQLANADDRSSALVRERDDVAGSQGVHASLFNDIVLGGRRDDMDVSAPDPLGFTVGGINVRRVTGRNTPSAINAVFNVRNFWDGRASRRFNGRNPFGDADSSARVLQVNDLGELVPVHISLDMASTASQADGPPLSSVEMSAGGRTFMKLGKKLLSLQPLAQQEVKTDDSVLGPLAVSGGKGLTTNYADMIRAAFNDKWWNSSQVVDGALTVLPGVTVPTDGTSLPTDQYTLMEANFSLFWGLAIAAYEATQVSDDTPFDQFREGNPTALTRQQQVGMRVFLGLDGGNCLDCHSGPEFSGAAVSARLDPVSKDGVLERMLTADQSLAVYDGGYYNIGVRKTTDDIGLGANDPFGNPLSLARREALQPGSVQDNMLFPPMATGERIVADGAFKTPSLRNVELTGPYFHNGGEATLSDVVQFYARGGNFHDENISNIHPEIHRMRGLIGHPSRQIALVDFLRGLTDERVRWYRAPFDHPELVVPNGAQGNEVSVLQDLLVVGPAMDATLHLPATGRSGADTPLKPFLNLSPFTLTSVPAPDPTTSELTLFATDTITCSSRLNVAGEIWCNGGVRMNSRIPHQLHGDITSGSNIVVTGDSLLMVGNMLSKGPISLSPGTFMDGVYASNCEYFAPMAMPALPAVPDLPLIQSSVSVPAFAKMTLTPGRYGTLYVNQGGWVVLQPGMYVFQRITLGIGAYLQYDPDSPPDQAEGPEGEMPIHNLVKVTVHVDNIDIARAAIISSGDVFKSTHLLMYVRTPNSLVLMGPESYFHGSLIAPTARVVMSNASTMAGAVYARTIEVAETATFMSHSLVAPPAEPLAAGFANMGAGPPSPEDAGAVAANLGLEFELGQNTPNPFRPNTTIRFALPSERDVELRVFDLSGRAVKTLTKGALGPGLHTLAWDGTSDRGSRLSSGVYFYRLVAGNDRAERKLVIVD